MEVVYGYAVDLMMQSQIPYSMNFTNFFPVVFVKVMCMSEEPAFKSFWDRSHLDRSQNELSVSSI
jgi:hypothetical protein